MLNEAAMTTCEWCGQTHALTVMCAARPRWTRRGFLALGGVGIVSRAVSGLSPLRLSGDRLGPVGTITLYGLDAFAVKQKLYSWDVPVVLGRNNYSVTADCVDVAPSGGAVLTECRLEVPSIGCLTRISSVVPSTDLHPIFGNTVTIQWPVEVVL